MEYTPCVFKKALDADMAHFLSLYFSADSSDRRNTRDFCLEARE
jgi:hypothetical protein